MKNAWRETMDAVQAQKRLIGFIRKNELIKVSNRLILGCSGGADSTAMVWLFARIRHILNVSLLAVHVNHQLRGEESDKDQEAVRELCMQQNIPLIIRSVEVPKSGNLENESRKLRFGVFREVQQNYECDRIVLAHHLDDQAETVLMNLFRGSGISGMAGIKPLSGTVIHPMLCFSRRELESLLSNENIPWRTDKSNLDPGFSRNRLRLNLIPQIQTEYNPQLSEHLARQAEIFYQAELLLVERTAKQYKRILLDSTPQSTTLALKPLLKLKTAERYYLYRMIFRQLSERENDFLSIHNQAIEDILKAEGSKTLNLPHGIKIYKLYEELVFSSAGEHADNLPEALEIGAERARAVFGDYRFQFKYLRILPKTEPEELGRFKIIIDADAIRYPFKIRLREPGDRFIPFGMTGFKRLKEFFIDEKVPKFERDLIPIFEDGEKLFWVVGHRVDNRVRYNENSTRFLEIIAEPTQEKPNRAANRKKNPRGNDESDEL